MNLAVALSMGESMDNLAPRAEEGKPAADEADAPAPRGGGTTLRLSRNPSGKKPARPAHCPAGSPPACTAGGRNALPG